MPILNGFVAVCDDCDYRDNGVYETKEMLIADLASWWDITEHHTICLGC